MFEESGFEYVRKLFHFLKGKSDVDPFLYFLSTKDSCFYLGRKQMSLFFQVIIKFKHGSVLELILIENIFSYLFSFLIPLFSSPHIYLSGCKSNRFFATKQSNLVDILLNKVDWMVFLVSFTSLFLQHQDFLSYFS